MKVVSVLTYKSAEHMISDGGSQAWRADRRRLRQAKYVVAARHAHSPFKPEGSEPHRHAFLVGEISDIVDADIDGQAHHPDGQPRVKIDFSRYALIGGPELPLSGQNPIQYWSNLAEIGIDESKLEWRDTPTTMETSPMDRAKEIVAKAHGVRPDQVEITIRF